MAESSKPSSAGGTSDQEQPTDLQAYVLKCASLPHRTNSRQSLLTKEDPLNVLFAKNKAWSRQKHVDDPLYFQKLSALQTPEYLWIGCSDSRVPANVILGLEAGEVFVQRNVGNQATHTDLNCMSCLEYAVTELKVKSIIVCGHYGCGAVKAALKLPSKTSGLVNCWISDIRECRNQHEAELRAREEFDSKVNRLCELNVLRQTFHVCTSPVIQAAWDRGQSVNVYGLIYSLKDGLIKKLVGPLSGEKDFVHDLKTFEDEQVLVNGATSPTASVSGGGMDSTLHGAAGPLHVSSGGAPNSASSEHGTTTKVVLTHVGSIPRVGSSNILSGRCSSGQQSIQYVWPNGEPADEDDLEHLRNTAALASKVTQHVAWSEGAH